MRLTLRTRLAYLDAVLDPAEKAELSQTSQSSDFAEVRVDRPGPRVDWTASGSRVRLERATRTGDR